MFIETKRLYIRPYATSDFDDYFEYIMDPELQHMLGLNDVSDRKSAHETFKWLLDNREFLAVIDNETGKAIGHICIHPPVKTLLEDAAFYGKKGYSLSFAISKDMRRKGCMEEALRSLIDELFIIRGMDYIDCEYTSFNAASHHLQDKLGFKFWSKEQLEEIELITNVLWRKDWDNIKNARTVDEDIRLIPYFRNDEESLPWYQDLDVCKQVDNIDHVYDLETLHAMYDFLSTHGNCYYVQYKGKLVGDVSLRDNAELAIVICKEYQNRHIGRKCILDMIELAKEKRMDKVKANIYSFNTQSQRMFQSIGFTQTDDEWFEFNIHRFTYFLFENFDAEKEADNPLNPRKICNTSADKVLTWMVETDKSFRNYDNACGLFGPEIIDALIAAGLFRKENEELFFDSPVFLSKDLLTLQAFFSEKAATIATTIEQYREKYYSLAKKLDNSYSPEILLYHVICGMCFDGLFLDKLGKERIIFTGRKHISGLDYLSVIYENAPGLDEFSKKLLCSYNRIQDAHCALQSFGDADGDRVDCYRYFRLKEQKRLTTKYSVVDKAADGLTQSDLLEAAVKLLMGDEADYRAVEALEQFGYFKGGKPCVPVFMDNDTSIILEIEELLEKHIWESVRELFSNLSGLNITAMANGVPVDEIANECWHILFGCINEKLIVDGFVACPDFYPDEGRYLKCIEFYKE